VTEDEINMLLNHTEFNNFSLIRMWHLLILQTNKYSGDILLK